MNPRPILFWTILCTPVALALWWWVAHETPTGDAPEAGNRPALALQRELPASSVPPLDSIAAETRTGSAGGAYGSAQALPPRLSDTHEETREVSSAPQNHRVASETLNADALRAGDESAQALYAKLLARIKQEGSMPLIVGFSAPVAPESDLVDPGEVDQQRQMLTAVQDIVLTDLAGVEMDGVKRFETVPYMALTVDAEGLTALVGSDPVITIEEDVALPPTLLDSVPLIGATPLHSSPPGYDGTGVTVAILDTGVDKSHPFLDRGKVVSEACYSTHRAADNATSACPGGVTESTAPGSGAACDYPGCNHGTWVAGMAAGKDGTGAGGGTLQGVAPGANIIAIQVFSKRDDPVTCDPSEQCVLSYVSDFMKGLERVYALRDTYKIAAANMSLGGGRFTSPCDSSALKATIDNLGAAGIATVISSGNAGNDGATGFPACISSATTVGASDKQDRLWSGSDHADWVDVIAPGVAIQSSIPEGAYGVGSGTSAAAPHVTGCFALFRHHRPSASVTAIEEALVSSATVSLSRDGISKPRIDCHAAVLAPAATTLVSPRGLMSDATPTYSWNAMAAATSYTLQIDRGASQIHSASYTTAQAGCTTGTGTCRVTPGMALQSSAYTWRIQAQNAAGKGPWSGRLDFSVDAPPGPATPISPRGATTDTTPTYSWEVVAAATSYTLQVDDGSGRVHSASYTTAQAGCTADTGTCRVTPSAVLQRGAHDWRIQTANRHGAGPWSERADFTVVGPPGMATLISPEGQTFDTTPTYRWNAVASATAYYLLIDSDVTKPWYTAEQAGCTEGTGICSLTPSEALEIGPHNWRILTGNAHGRGPWSEKLLFRVDTVPGAATLSSPQGTTTETTPTYSWEAVAAATSYTLQVDRGASQVHSASYTTAQAGCAAGTGICRVTPSTALQGGAHSWWVQTGNSQGPGLRSAPTSFTVRVEGDLPPTPGDAG